MTQKIIPHLWFDKNAKEAAIFYADLFGGSVGVETYYTEAGFEIHGMTAGTLLTVEFDIFGTKMMALNGGPAFKINPAISFTLQLGDKEEVERIWSALISGGKPLMELQKYPFSELYGWVEDKYGVSWQLNYIPGADKNLVPSLLFTGHNAGKAEEAIELYTSIFPGSSTGLVAKYEKDQVPSGADMVAYADFKLAGQTFIAMDSFIEHAFNFNEGISLLVVCETQEEIDEYWEKLSAEKEAEQCGWLKDKYGVSWQIVPEGMDEMLNNPDKAKVNRVMEAFLKMKKISIKEIEQAFAEE